MRRPFKGKCHACQGSHMLRYCPNKVKKLIIVDQMDYVYSVLNLTIPLHNVLKNKTGKKRKMRGMMIEQNQ